MRKHQNKRRGFTLIELLTVITIIAILVGLLFPAIKKAIEKAEKGKAETTIMNVGAAFRAYYLDYGRWPTGATGSPQDLTTNLFTNPRNTVYLDTASKDVDSTGRILDPWKSPFQIVFDTDYNHQIANPLAGSGSISADVIIWSGGPDGQADTGGESSALNKDNVKSW